MADTRFHVLGIGNAIVDVLAYADEEFLVKHGLDKGRMTLIDADRTQALYDAMAPAVESSGGSAANTVASLASLGLACAFVGKVHDDQWGAVFRHDIETLGVAFDTRLSRGGAPTARCLIFVTPDAQRTMQTFLGACVELGPGDVHEKQIAAAEIIYLEGYLWDPPEAKQAFVKAAGLAHAAGRRVALSLSDPLCVARHREDFLDLVNDHVDIVFANEAEITALYRVDEFDAALQSVRGHCAIAALTRSEKGSVIVSGDDVYEVVAAPVERVVDTTGAGDQFAAGFLYGYTQGRGVAECGQIGSIAAAEIITHYGARPEVALSSLLPVD